MQHAITMSEECLAGFMLMLIKTSESLNYVIQIGGKGTIEALEVIYEQSYKIAPNYVKGTKQQFVDKYI